MKFSLGRVEVGFSGIIAHQDILSTPSAVLERLSDLQLVIGLSLEVQWICGDSMDLQNSWPSAGLERLFGLQLVYEDPVTPWLVYGGSVFLHSCVETQWLLSFSRVTQ